MVIYGLGEPSVEDRASVQVRLFPRPNTSWVVADGSACAGRGREVMHVTCYANP